MVKKGFANILSSLLITLLLGLAILLGFVGFQSYNKYRSKGYDVRLFATPTASPTLPQVVSVMPSPTNVLPSLSAPLQPTVTPSKNKGVLKNEIFNLTGFEVDAFDVSKDGTTVAFLGHDAKWSSYGAYLYKVAAKKATSLYELKQSITGRGAYYADNLDIKFSPSGNFLFANKTGTNFPQFMIFNSNGETLYTSKTDLGHATWIDDNNLLYVSSLQIKPLVFNTTSMDANFSNLPENIFGLSANSLGNSVASFSLASKALQCESFDLKVYSYPSGKLVKQINNVLLGSTWQSSTTINVQKVESCQKNSGGEMLEYSPVTAAQIVDINTP